MSPSPGGSAAIIHKDVCYCILASSAISHSNHSSDLPEMWRIPHSPPGPIESLGCQRSESKSGMAIWASWNAEKRPGENPRHGWWRWWLRDHSSSRQILGALSGFAFAVSLVSRLGFKTDLSFPNSGTWFQQIQEPSVTIWEKTIVISFHCFCFQIPVFASFQ